MNRYTTPIQFAFEKNVVTVSGKMTFGAGGAVVLDPINSKGIAAVYQVTPTFTANTVGSSATMSSVSSFSLLYPGMTLTNIGGNALPAGVTISSITVSATNQTITMSTGTGVPSNNAGTFTATGGLYTFQFGFSNNTGQRLDAYNKLMAVNWIWDQSIGSASSSTTVNGLIPATSQGWVVQNRIGIRTIPATLTSASTDCSLSLVLGNGNATAFLAANPNPGDTLRVDFLFCNSTAI